MTIGVQLPAGRRFLRNLNIALKSGRMYGFDHQRCSEQLNQTWTDLEAAIDEAPGEELILGVTGGKLLVGETPVEMTPAEEGFAKWLGTNGIGSIQFASGVTQDEFRRFVQVLAGSGPKGGPVGDQLREAMAGSGIHVNQFRYVAEDASRPRGPGHAPGEQGRDGEGDAEAATGQAGPAAGDPVAMGLLGVRVGSHVKGPRAEQGHAAVPEWLTNPAKLLQVFASTDLAGDRTESLEPVHVAEEPGAVTGALGRVSPQEVQLRTVPLGGAGAMGDATVLGEEEVLGLVQFLGRMGHAGRSGVDLRGLQKEYQTIPAPAQLTLQQAMAHLASATPNVKPDGQFLVRLAEHLAIRHALERFERGEVKVNAVRETLQRLSEQIKSLRQLMGAQEEKMKKAGLAVESAAELLDRQFWEAVPESGKRSVLLSPDAWCIPAHNVREYVEQLSYKGEEAQADEVLESYALCVRSTEAEARQKTAVGLKELAELFVRRDANPEKLGVAIRQTGEQLSREADSHVLAALDAAFLRLSQAAVHGRSYAGVAQIAIAFRAIEDRQSGHAHSLRPRIGVENHLTDFLEDALQAPERQTGIPSGLVEVLQEFPHLSTELLMMRLVRCTSGAVRQRLLEIVSRFGSDFVDALGQRLKSRSRVEAIGAVGLLTRLDPAGLERELPQLMRGSSVSEQTMMLQQLLAGGAPGLGSQLARLLPQFDRRLQPMIVEEIGMAQTGRPNEIEAVAGLVRLAEGSGQVYPLLRIKAIESLGRLRATSTAPMLRRIVESKQMWRWQHPHELRLVAAQALEKIDPNGVRGARATWGFEESEFRIGPLEPRKEVKWVRQRRYERFELKKPLWATFTTPNGLRETEVLFLSLGGGLADCTESLFAPGTEAGFQLRLGRVLGLPLPVGAISAQVLMRNQRPGLIGFEFVEMDFEDRGRLRKLLISEQG